MIETSLSEENVPSPLLELTAKFGKTKYGYGVLLLMKSEKWEDLFSSISGGKYSHVKKEGIEGDFYDFPLATTDRTFFPLAPSGKYLIDYAGDGGDGRGGGGYLVNLTFLRMVGLGKGQELFFKGIFEKETVKKFAHKAAEKSVDFYKKLSPGSVKVKVWVDDWKVGERVVV